MRRRPLVRVVAAGLAGQREGSPGTGEAGGVGQHPETHVLGERLAQPYVVPPAHGDQVAEPHVSHLVRDHDGPDLPLGLGHGGRRQEIVPERHAARVLDRPGLQFRDERLVVRVVRVRLGEDLLVAVEAGLGDGEEFRRIPAQGSGQRPPGVQAERDAAMLGADADVRTGHQRHQVGGDGRGGGELPAAVAGRAGQPVADHGPVARRGDRRADGRLQVRLVEGGEDPLSIVQPAVQGEVGLAVGGVGEPVQARAGTRVRHVRLDPQLVGFLQAGQR